MENELTWDRLEEAEVLDSALQEKNLLKAADCTLASLNLNRDAKETQKLDWGVKDERLIFLLDFWEV